MKPSGPFDDAVSDYIASLNDAKRQELRNTTPIPRSDVSWPWFEDVINRYRLRERGSPVVRDINERIDPDPYGINSSLWGEGGSEPIFEAMTLLNAVCEVLKAQIDQ